MLVRGAYLYFSIQTPFFEPLLLDPAYYHEWAVRILTGEGWGDPVFYGLPLYPIFLAFLYKIFSASFLAVKIIQHGLGVLTVFFVYKIGESLSKPRVGLFAAAWAALYAPLFFSESMFIPETLGVPLYAAAFWAALRFEERESTADGILLGMLAGLAALTKAGILLFILIFLGWRLWSAVLKKTRKAPVFCALVGLALILSPVTLHNWIAGKDFVWLTSHGGFNFYIGNNPEAEGTFTAPEGTGTNVEAQREDSKAIAEEALGRELRPSEVSGYWSGKAWNFIVQNPQKFFELSFRKVLLFFDAREISDLDDPVFVRAWNPVLKIPWLNFSILGPLFLLGLLAAWRVIRHRVLLCLWVGFYLLGLVGFFVNARYRLPLLSVFFPIAALGILEMIQSVRSAGWKRLLFCGIILAGGIALTRTHLVGTNYSRDWVNVGDVYQMKNDFTNALSCYEKALSIEPDFPKANQAIAVTLTKMGRHDEAKKYYERVLTLDPHNALAYNNLGLLADRAGELTIAKDYFLKALELKPHHAQAHNNLGMVYGKMGESDRALAEFDQALKFNPKSARTWTNKGLILYRMGRHSEAREAWKKALTADPGFKEARKALTILDQQLN